MAALCNAQHEKFARAIVAGRNATQAYVDAGFARHRQNAHRLITQDYIQRRITELKQERKTNSQNDRDKETGRFLPGNSGFSGRPKGSRSKLAEQFIADLHDEWEKSGAAALERVAQSDPVQFVKVVASVLPAKIDTTLTIESDLFKEIADFREAWRLARAFIGSETAEGERMEMQMSGDMNMVGDIDPRPLLELQPIDDDKGVP